MYLLAELPLIPIVYNLEQNWDVRDIIKFLALVVDIE